MYVEKLKDLEEWDLFVEKSDNGRIFHTSRWLETVSKLRKLNYEIYVIKNKAGEIIGGFPITYRKFFRWYISIHPRLTPYLGAVVRINNKKNRSEYYTKQKKILKTLSDYLRDLPKIFLYSRFSPEIKDMQAFLWNNFQTIVRYTYILNLSSDIETIWKNFSSSRRRDIKKGKKDNITVYAVQDLDTLLELIESTYGHKNEKPDFLSELKVITKTFENYRIFVSKKGNVNLGGVFVLWDSRQSYYLTGGVNRENPHHSAMALAMWESIKFCKAIGLNYFDFEGSSIPQIERFFRGFGGDLIPYYAILYSPLGKISPYSRIY